MGMMTKHSVITLFKGQKKLADALGVTTQAISQWPEQLPQAFQDRIIGAALRSGMDVSGLINGLPQQEDAA